MRKKQFLAAILLGVVFCFVSGVGYGEIIQSEKPSVSWYMEEYAEEPQKGLDLWREDCDLALPSMLDYQLLWATLMYVMSNPTDFAYVTIFYDLTGWFEELYPPGVITKGKISVEVKDVRGYFGDRSGVALREAFKAYLEVIYTYIDQYTTDGNTDIVARFLSIGGIPLGYFYQGEYHLWEE